MSILPFHFASRLKPPAIVLLGTLGGLSPYMPRKHQARALQIKPQSSSPHTFAVSRSSRPQNEASSQRSVNDLIRESRRVQLKSDARTTPTPENARSVHPSVRAVLDLPAPPPPTPRARDLLIAAVSTGSGPSRLRRIPGPPPPRSWLTDSIHAPPAVQAANFLDEAGGHRVQVWRSNLPEAAFPPANSLQHLVLKKIAIDWKWHAENDLEYFCYLPAKVRETLLSYIAVYGDDVKSNPLKVLFPQETEIEDRDEVTRLDVSNALGHWTTLKQLERDLLTKNAESVASQSTPKAYSGATEPALESWDAESDSDDVPIAPTINPIPKTIHNFANLKHLSLAISPGNSRAASWSSLLSLATELRTLSSLSLAYWPQPTLTPNAASTRAVIHSPGSRPVVYGGSDMYTSFDNNWREAAGILRTLSRSLYCLKWLDLTGCGDWFSALQWVPSAASSVSSSPEANSSPPQTAQGQRLGPEWNGGWRGLDKLILEVGWKPVPPQIEDDHLFASDTTGWNVENERRLYRHKKDREQFAEIRGMAQSVAHYVRAIRKSAGGKWIDVELGEDLAPEGDLK